MIDLKLTRVINSATDKKYNALFVYKEDNDFCVACINSDNAVIYFYLSELRFVDAYNWGRNIAINKEVINEARGNATGAD